MKQGKKKDNAALQNIISPIFLGYTQTAMQLGENQGKGYGIVRYSAENPYGWLSQITNQNSALVGITYSPLDTGDMIDIMDSNINAAKKRMIDTKKASEETRAEKEILHSRKLLDEMDDKNESIGLISTVVMPIGKQEVFEKIDRRVKSTVKKAGCRMRCMANLQKETYQQLSPAYVPSDRMQGILGRVIPLSTLIGGFPFSKSGLNDGEGYYVAKDTAGGILTISPWIRGDDRTNSNMAVLGNSGTGKSTITKSMMLNEYMMGTKLIVIDPEDEYKDLCHNFQGSWLNAAGSDSCKINPLQIKVVPRDQEDISEKSGKEKQGSGPLALYLSHLETFFSLYLPNMKDDMLADLKQLLIEVYEQKGITFQTDITGLNPEDYPIMEDVVKLAEQKGKESAQGDNYYSRIASRLRDAAYGADAFLFNGYSTIHADSSFVCISTSGLNDSSDRIKRTQYFNILNWAWNEISSNRQERVILVCDEAYLLIDPNIPQSLIFLRNAMKRARKYEAAIWVISQNQEDFLADSVKMYGQELLENPTYKILMGTEGVSLEKMTELYHLTEEEIRILEAKKRGDAIMMLGSRRMHVHFEIPEYQFQYFGTAGGR